MLPIPKLVFVDLETTGANPIDDRIIEIGIVCVEGDQVDRWSSLVDPGIAISPFIQNLTGISNQMVREAPVFEDLVDELLLRLEGGIFIAHNARFDSGFLKNALKATGHKFCNKVLCTVKLSRKLYPDYVKHSLDSLVARHGLVSEARHRALADADLLWQFWQKIKSDISAEILEKELSAVLQQQSVPTNLDNDWLQGIPDAPGVYLFYGENELPLYVGKSVHLRKRVQSHFSADHRLYKDMRLSQQVHRVTWQVTAGEIGALLLEARLIKELQPIHNRVLRRQRDLCAWQLRTNSAGVLRPILVHAGEQDFGHADGLYGLFSSRKKAESRLRELAEEYDLCLVMLGLESRSSQNKPCFAYQLQRCRGACTGREPTQLHSARLEAALAGLKVQTWPYQGVVGLIEESTDGQRQDVHIVDSWCCLGTVPAGAEQDVLQSQAEVRPAFDKDTYQIVSRALQQKKVTVKLFEAGKGNSRTEKPL
jgi:DNA polymerase III subunit epsilon